MKTRVGVIFGGRSGEHEISIRSAKTVIEQADPEKYEIVPIAITPEGVWLDAEKSRAFFENGGTQETKNHKELLYPVSRLLSPTSLDVIFPVLHGTYGEDGTIQGLFEMADLPYVGCGVLASSTGMDKAFMKTLFRDAGLPLCDYVWFLRDEWVRNREATLTQVANKLGFPCFVKPANLGSSVGVSKAVDPASLAEAISLAAEYDRKIIVEEGLEMREIECAVIGNDLPQASLPGEYIIRDSSKAFLDYTEKYSGTGNNEFVVPAPVSPELSARIRQMAVTAFKAIDGSGLARVDFFLRNDNGALLVNEVNTMPGLTDASGFPKMWAGTGKAFPQVIDELIQFAFERHKDKKKNKTTK
ncbi:MAG: D-alanine--D-alanine ligase [Chloracidobacterium sp.]|nr:D-alanine--D-alanine ligase [Chloracidobacterium sp.]